MNNYKCNHCEYEGSGYNVHELVNGKLTPVQKCPECHTANMTKLDANEKTKGYNPLFSSLKEFICYAVGPDKGLGITLWSSQMNILTSLDYWYTSERANNTMIIKYLYLFPRAGHTTLWKIMEKFISNVEIIPLMHDGNYKKTRLNVETNPIKFRGKSYKDKLVIFDVRQTPFNEEIISIIRKTKPEAILVS